MDLIKRYEKNEKVTNIEETVDFKLKNLIKNTITRIFLMESAVLNRQK